MKIVQSLQKKKKTKTITKNQKGLNESHQPACTQICNKALFVFFRERVLLCDYVTQTGLQQLSPCLWPQILALMASATCLELTHKF